MAWIIIFFYILNVVVTFLDIVSTLCFSFYLYRGIGVSKSWRITHGEGNGNTIFAFRRSWSRIIFCYVLLSWFLWGIAICFPSPLMFSPPVAGRWASAPWTAALFAAHLRIFRTLVRTDKRCAGVCEKSLPTENIFSGCVRVCVRACDSPTPTPTPAKHHIITDTDELIQDQLIF